MSTPDEMLRKYEEAEALREKMEKQQALFASPAPLPSIQGGLLYLGSECIGEIGGPPEITYGESWTATAMKQMALYGNAFMAIPGQFAERAPHSFDSADLTEIQHALEAGRIKHGEAT